MSLSRMDCNCRGLKRRQELKQKVSEARERPGKVLDPRKKILVNLGGGQVKQLGLSELTERERQSPEWQTVAAGGLRVIPVVEFRLSTLPKPLLVDDAAEDNKVDFKTHIQSRKAQEIGYYSAHLTEDAIEKELMDEFRKLKAVGLGNKDAEKKVFATKKKKHEALQSWKDTKAEITLKLSLEELLLHLRVPGLLVRSVEHKARINNPDGFQELRNLDALHALGLDGLPPQAGEIDLLLAYVAGNHLHIVLCEVKRQNLKLWESQDGKESKALIRNIGKAFEQLLADCDVILGLLADLPGSSIVLHTISCFPDTSVSVLKEILCNSCIESVLCKEDLADMVTLRKKLMIPDDTMTWTDEALENLLRLDTRLVGQHSLLHIGWRKLKDIGKLEAGRMDFNVQSVEERMRMGEYVLAAPDQQAAFAVAHRNGPARHLTVRGRAGSGKTVTLLGLVREHMRQPGKKLLIVTAYRQQGTDRIMKYLSREAKNLAEETMVLGWRDILNYFNISTRKFQISRKDVHRNEVIDTPAIISYLSKNVAYKFPDRQVVLAVDELDAGYAPNTRDGLRNDWSQINVPSSVSLVLVFNPGSIRLPLELSTDPSFYHVSCDLRFRSTLSITDVVNCVTEHSGQGLQVADKSATDVVGVEPILMDLGNLQNVFWLERALQEIKTCLDSEGRLGVTLLHDWHISDAARSTVTKMAERAGWETYLAGDFTGSEADTVVFVGPGGLEPLSRAKLRLCVVLMWDTEKGKNKYDRYHKGFTQAICQGLVTVSKDWDLTA